MNRPIVLDLESFFWDPQSFNECPNKYFSLLATLPSLLQGLRPGKPASQQEHDEGTLNQMPLFVCTEALLDQIYAEVFGGCIHQHLTSYALYPILSFLSLVRGSPYKLQATCNVTVTPEINKTHFNLDVKGEVHLIICEIHGKGSGVFTFFSFQKIWSGGGQEICIVDSTDTEVRVEVVIADDKEGYEEYKERKERVFVPSKKHDTLT